MTLHCGRFNVSVSQKRASISTAAAQSNPAISNPRACPPPPAHSSSTRGFLTCMAILPFYHVPSGAILYKRLGNRKFLTERADLLADQSELLLIVFLFHCVNHQLRHVSRFFFGESARRYRGRAEADAGG